MCSRYVHQPSGKQDEGSSSRRGLVRPYIAAFPVASAREHTDADIILLGPQVRFAKSKVQGEVGADKIVQDIDMQAYGTMNGKKVIAQVKKALGD